MKNTFMVFSLILTVGIAAFGQSASDEYKKSEFFIGYSNGQVDTGLDSGDTLNAFLRDRQTFHGVNVSGVYNLTRYVGIKGDVSGTYKNAEFSQTITDVTGTYTISASNDSSLYNFLGGVQFKDNASERRLKPFGHVMIGAAHARTKIKDFSCSPSVNCVITGLPDTTFSETGLAGVVGGGLDIRINRRFQFRAVQLDYNPMKIGNSVNNSFRIGTGIVF